MITVVAIAPIQNMLNQSQILVVATVLAIILTACPKPKEDTQFAEEFEQIEESQNTEEDK